MSHSDELTIVIAIVFNLVMSFVALTLAFEAHRRLDRLEK